MNEEDVKNSLICMIANKLNKNNNNKKFLNYIIYYFFSKCI